MIEFKSHIGSDSLSSFLSTDSLSSFLSTDSGDGSVSIKQTDSFFLENDDKQSISCNIHNRILRPERILISRIVRCFSTCCVPRLFMLGNTLYLILVLFPAAVLRFVTHLLVTYILVLKKLITFFSYLYEENHFSKLILSFILVSAIFWIPLSLVPSAIFNTLSSLHYVVCVLFSVVLHVAIFMGICERVSVLAKFQWIDKKFLLFQYFFKENGLLNRLLIGMLNKFALNTLQTKKAEFSIDDGMLVLPNDCEDKNKLFKLF